MLNITYKDVPLLFTIIFLFAAVVVAIFWVKQKSTQDKKRRAFEKQFRYAINPDEEQEEEVSNVVKTFDKLPTIMLKSGVAKETSSVEEVRRIVLLLMALSFIAPFALFGNFFMSLFPPAIVYGGLYLLSNKRISKKKIIMNEQIPSFVSTFKANIQANQHTNNAMISAIDNTVEPLYDELAYAREIMVAGDFRAGIVMLRTQTDDETLRQLCSCIELANDVGANLEEQIDVIEEIIEDKQEIERKKRLGINENKPLFIASAVFIPGSFIGSYALSEMHKNYWFTTPASFLILIAVIIAMTIAVYSTWKVIQNIDIG